jgi:hypothetical protein
LGHGIHLQSLTRDKAEVTEVLNRGSWPYSAPVGSEDAADGGWGGPPPTPASRAGRLAGRRTLGPAGGPRPASKPGGHSRALAGPVWSGSRTGAGWRQRAAAGRLAAHCVIDKLDAAGAGEPEAWDCGKGKSETVRKLA